MLDEIESKSVHKDKEGVDRGKISKAINETLQISTQQEIAIGTHFHGRHDTKTTPVFLPAYGEPLSCYFQVIVTIRRHSTTEKYPFLYSPSDRSVLKKHIKDKCKHQSQLPSALNSLSQFQLI